MSGSRSHKLFEKTWEDLNNIQVFANLTYKMVYLVQKYFLQTQKGFWRFKKYYLLAIFNLEQAYMI